MIIENPAKVKIRDTDFSTPFSHFGNELSQPFVYCV